MWELPPLLVAGRAIPIGATAAHDFVCMASCFGVLLMNVDYNLVWNHDDCAGVKSESRYGLPANTITILLIIYQGNSHRCD